MKKIGKNIVANQYIHLSLLNQLSESDQLVVKQATLLAGVQEEEQFNVIKLSDNREIVTLLDYPDFFTEGFPILARYWTVNLATETYRHRTYEDSQNPPVLHRKELLISSKQEQYEQFCKLTVDAETIGLFDDPNRIGFLRAWESLLKLKGFSVVGHDLVPVGNLEKFGSNDEEPISSESGIARHLTALTRYNLSAPMQTLARFGYLDGRKSVFDYGCGKGGDLQALHENNVVASGWDPYYAADDIKKQADIVNLGFVINVIESLDERVEAIQGAYELANELIVISAMLANPEAVKGRPYGDGVLTSRNTFQKYFTQAELSHFISETLHEESLPVGPGIFYVFKDKDAEQRFVYSRFVKKRPPAIRVKRAPTERRTKVRVNRVQEKYERHQALLEPLWHLWLQLGRKPERNEVNIEEIGAALGSLPAAQRLIMAYKGEEGAELLNAAETARVNDLRVYFANLQFGKRRPFKHMEQRQKSDIKHFFGTFKAAVQEGERLLFETTQVANINAACQEAAEHGLGWLDESHSLQLHTSLVEQLPAVLRCYVSCGTLLYGDVSSADLIKIHIRSGKLTLMTFDKFDESPLPRLLERVKINLRSQRLDFFDYGEIYIPPYLYLKSRFINEEHPFFAEQASFDEKLEQLNLADLSGFGPSPEELEALLEERRYCIKGFNLERSQTIPNLDDACGLFLKYRDLIECGETQAETKLPNLPKQPDSYTALLELSTQLLDPIIDYFGMIKLTYGFCSPELARKIPGRVAPKLDQHGAHERNRLGHFICSRGGAAIDFLVEDEDMIAVAYWIANHLSFDRLYLYGSDKPIHISYNFNNVKQVSLMKKVKSRKNLIPKTMDSETFLNTNNIKLQLT
ncbi:DNA phosphorothioation-associated putative methyltransferase [Marinobacter antarcticus]|uniref:DNA phosphorothioation-associated putative methyltransferase n=1 Tax=Marinobacter antarcticus TaxID=564117 RepID=A0A1M6U848_9GAMM|nr:DNA phosphorothioation-associated putative methyltransferase [Marinobacter antarcticus]SHK65367.1 DNA phosphorothioation-associated putative methyltransferase [Marinobacter antarcticus]